MVKAAREVLSWGPRLVIAKQGEYGAALITEDSFFALPAYPLEDVIDPTGAGDSFAGGFLGYISQHLSEGGELDDDAFRRAMTYGSTMASFNVENFGTERVRDLTGDEIAERFQGFIAITRFEEVAGDAPLDRRQPVKSPPWTFSFICSGLVGWSSCRWSGAAGTSTRRSTTSRARARARAAAISSRSISSPDRASVVPRRRAGRSARQSRRGDKGHDESTRPTSQSTQPRRRT